MLNVHEIFFHIFSMAGTYFQNFLAIPKIINSCITSLGTRLVESKPGSTVSKAGNMEASSNYKGKGTGKANSATCQTWARTCIS